METELTFDLLNTLWNSVTILVRGVTWMLLIIIAYKFFKTRLDSKTSTSTMPGLNVPFYDIYGSFRAFPSNSTMKKMSLPSIAYVLQFFGGLVAMFGNKKVIKFTAAFTDVYVAGNAESVQEILSSKAATAKPFTGLLTTFFGKGFFTSSGAEWKFGKKSIAPVFHHDVIKSFIPKVNENSKMLVDILRSRQHEQWVDIAEHTKLCALNIICETFVGINLRDQKEIGMQIYRRMSRALHTATNRTLAPIFYFDTIFRFTAIGRQFKEDMHYLRTFFDQVVQQKRDDLKLPEKERKESIAWNKTMKNNLAHLVMDIHANTAGYTEEDTKDELLSFVSAGADTVAAGLTWALYLIGLHPEIQHKIHEELDYIFGDDRERYVTEDDLKDMRYLECAIKESQRLYPPAPQNGRYVDEDLNLCGYKIKKGSMVFLDLYSLHRDPNVFSNPEVFDPERFLPENSANYHPYAFIPFSNGIRSCPGRVFAMMELKIVIANVLRNFAVKSLEERDKIIMYCAISLQSVSPVKLKFTTR